MAAHNRNFGRVKAARVGFVDTSDFAKYVVTLCGQDIVYHNEIDFNFSKFCSRMASKACFMERSYWRGILVVFDNRNCFLATGSTLQYDPFAAPYFNSGFVYRSMPQPYRYH
ncbi:MAG: hypothetical protein ABJP90_17740 [Paracoccaceae bacterium]